MSNIDYVVSDDTSLGRDDTEMREEAAEYFSINPKAKRCGFLFMDEYDLESVENDDGLDWAIGHGDWYIFKNLRPDENIDE
jgi:hypothetical protein|tara:strand:+ start:461 stop:703 length:243 start_codon:yes stop_codon:yes gene_type:complete